MERSGGGDRSCASGILAYLPEAEGSIIIEKVRRWEPNDAYLYTVRIEYEEDQYEFVRGEHPWNSADFATIQGVMSASAEISV